MKVSEKTLALLGQQRDQVVKQFGMALGFCPEGVADALILSDGRMFAMTQDGRLWISGAPPETRRWAQLYRVEAAGETPMGTPKVDAGAEVKATLRGTFGVAVAKDNHGRAIDFFWGVDILWGWGEEQEADGPALVKQYKGAHTREGLLAELRELRRKGEDAWAFAVPRGVTNWEDRKRYAL